ncbi:MAG: patatin-like phospholipase family protein [Aquamicrobium sp.]|uniref:patatin-like phospholipase family protein n=1 Tax=Aquamicrobium sp. TaxID=1872579 RepID=UPI00349E63A3|nr:patatin-like phospholipase family protein [Aquamicrobium sp.]
MAHYRVGLALGGGAARGWSHIGVIEALVEAGIEPVAVAGTSMGALVGAAHAAGRLGALKEWALAVDWRTIVSLVDLGLAGGGIVDGQRIRALLGQLGIDGEIRSFPVPFAAVATDLADGREIWLQDGPADLAIRASISMPGIFSPVLVGERWLVDGGLVNQVPVSTCRAMGADFVIAVHVGDGLLGRRRERLRVDPEGDAAALAARVAQMLEQVPFALRETAGRVLPHLLKTETRAPGYFDVLVNSLNIMQEKINRSRLAGEPRTS